MRAPPSGGPCAVPARDDRRLAPKVAECHQNADAWVSVHPEFKVVRGWVTYASFGGDSVAFMAHSVVRDQSGRLFDITPLLNETVRTGMRFVEHEGDPDMFIAMKALGIFIHRLDFGNWDGQSFAIDDEMGDEE